MLDDNWLEIGLKTSSNSSSSRTVVVVVVVVLVMVVVADELGKANIIHPVSMKD